MVFNKRDLEKTFSPGKSHKYGKRAIVGTKPSTSGATDTTRSENSATSIRVIVRVRPANEKESQDNYRTVVKVVDDRMLIFDPKEEESPFYYRGVAQKGRDLLKKQNKELEFIFDRVFDETCDNCSVFEGTTRDIISSLLDGYNCSVFAYGATGAGKTHTMLGREDDPGITFRTMSELFARMETQADDREFNLGVTYLEVYNENVYDLLHKASPLAIRDDGRHGIVVADLKVVPIKSADELFALLARGNKNRTQHPTDANEESSRSHAVFQVYVNVTNKLDGQKKRVKLSMIDLAGSERASATGCKGARFKEGANINKSLLALGNCINNLADGIKHIPYRDSKLTRLLKDSLGGNCQTVMIANVGPSSLSFEDTYNTLRYANRAKKIKLNVKKNIVSCQMHVTGYIKMVEEQRKEINALKEKLLALESRTPVAPERQIVTSLEDKELDELRARSLELKRERGRLNEKILSLQSNDKILCCRIQYKIAADNRLRNLTAALEANGEEQNASGKSRINRSLLYFKRQREVIRIQMQSAWDDLRSVETRIEALELGIEAKKLGDKLAETCSSQSCELDKIRLRQRYEHAKKISSLLQCEVASIDSIARTACSTLQKYYNTMRDCGITTDQMKVEFKQLVKSLEGVRNIKWADSEIEKATSEDSYLLTCLSTEELDEPLTRSMPIYRAPYLADDDTVEITEAAIIEPSLNSTITLEESVPREDTNGTLSESLAKTAERCEVKAKKRNLAEKSQSSVTPAKQAKKVSPKERGAPNPNIGKENKSRPPSVMSAKSIAILNKLKSDRWKLLPQLANSTFEGGNGDGSLCNKVVRVKERRGIANAHPYQKVANARPK